MPNLNLKVGSLRGSAKFSTNRDFKKMVSGNETLSHVLNTEKKKQNFYSDLRKEALAHGEIKNSTIQNVMKQAEKEKYISSSARAELKKGLLGKAMSVGESKIAQEKHRAVDHRGTYAEIMEKRNNVPVKNNEAVSIAQSGQAPQRIGFAKSDAKLHRVEEIEKSRSSQETGSGTYVDKDTVSRAKDMIARITAENSD